MENTPVPPNFSARIADTAARFPERVAIEHLGADLVEATTYRALMEAAGSWMASLATRGIQAGDRVAILGENNASWIAAYLGILQTGAVAVPLDTAYTAAQVRTVIDDCGARAVLATSRQVDTARKASIQATHAPAVLLLSDRAADRAEVAPSGTDAHAHRQIASTNDAAAILYTSGTTADPKGVVLTHANLDAERVAALGVIDCAEHDVVLGVLPLFHSLAQMANLLVPLSVGARVVFLENVNSSSLVAALQERGVTIFVCVPQFFYLIHQRVFSEIARAGFVRRLLFRGLLRANGRLREHLGWNPGRRWFARVHRGLGRRVRLLITGGSRFDPAIGRDLYALGFTLLNGYGLTETSGAATVQRPGDRYTTSVGPALPGVEIRITDGEILIRGDIVMREYFNRPEATAETLRDGWLHTGDLGRLDADGRLYVTGRLKEVIVLSSGKNLYPEEIEAHYRQSPFIKELCVLGMTRPDAPTGERLHAVVVPDEQVLRDRGVVNLRELIRFELEGLSVQAPAHKRVLTYDIWLEALPRTTTGKLKRHEIERRVGEQAVVDAAADERPLTEDECQWLTEPSRAAALGAVAAALRRPAVRPDANLELDLGLDSMERVELLTTFEQRTGTSVPPEQRATIFTVRQLIDAVGSSGANDVRTAGASDVSRAWDAVLSGAPDPAIVENLRRRKWIRAVCLFVVIRICAAAARLALGLRATGREHLPNGPVIISPNHQSYLDGFFLAATLPFHVFRRLFFVGAAEYFETPVMRWLAQGINIVPVDPDANLVSAMQAGAAGLRLNKVLMLFPEGERTIDGELRRFRKGVGILSAHLDVPVVPVALEGLYALWPRSRPFNWRGLLPWRRTRVAMAFGAPITVVRGAYTDGADAIGAAVGQMLERLRSRMSGALE